MTITQYAQNARRLNNMKEEYTPEIIPSDLPNGYSGARIMEIITEAKLTQRSFEIKADENGYPVVKWTTPPRRKISVGLTLEEIK